MVCKGAVDIDNLESCEVDLQAFSLQGLFILKRLLCIATVFSLLSVIHHVIYETMKHVLKVRTHILVNFLYS